MSYVQGTDIRLRAVFTVTETQAAEDPDTVTLVVVPPVGAAYTRTGGALENPAPGEYSCIIDTPEAGTYRYEWRAPKVVGQRSFTVRSSIAPATV
jgi:hypothetical protein